MSKTATKLRQNGVTKAPEEASPIKNGKTHSCSPIKRLKASEGEDVHADGPSNAVPLDSDDAELARKLHEQLNGPDSPTAAPITRHITRVRKAPVFYKPEALAHALQQVGGNQAYHGVDGSQEQEDGLNEVSPKPAKDQHVPRELRRLHDHSVSMSDSGDARSNHPAGPRRTRAGSVPDPSSDDKQMPARSADHAGRKRSGLKTEEDADTHSQSDTHQRAKRRSATPELRAVRSLQPSSSQQHPVGISDQRRTGRSLPVKLEQPTASGDRTALHQGSSGSPGKATGSTSLGHKRRSGKGAALDGEGAVKAEVTSSRLRHGTGGASTSGESHSHADPAGPCPDQADAVGGSGRRGSDGAAPGVPKRAKLPAKNPMVLQKQNGSYYRVRVLKEEAFRVRIEFMGFEQQLQPSWLARDSERIWRGSYKNKAWKHLGDGAWEPRAGEKGTPAVAHGTHQNQYTKRKALLTASGNNTSSNNDSDGNVGSSEDNRDHQHGMSADTGFADEPLGRGSKESQGEGASVKDEEEKSGRLSRLQGRASGNRPGHRAARAGRMRGSSNLKAAEATADTREEESNTPDAEEGADAKVTLASDSNTLDAATASHASRARTDTKADAPSNRHPTGASLTHPDRQSGDTADAAKPNSAVKDEAQTSSADENAGNQSNNAGAAAQGPGRPSKGSGKGSGAVGKTGAADATELKQTAADDKREAVRLSGSAAGKHADQQAEPSGQQAKAGAGKGPSGLEAALQCEENLASDDAAVSPADGAAGKDKKDADGKAAAAAEADPPRKAVVKPRRDRKGRIRGTYGINAKPVEPEPPTEASPPGPGVTRASLRPKPVAKALPDDEEADGLKPSAAPRHVRAAAGGPEAGAVPDSPSSPKAQGTTEVRRPNGRNAMQRRAAAANFAVAAAVAAEAADAIPAGTQHSSRAFAKVQAAHKRSGSNGMTKTGLDHVRSGRITKAMSGGSSGAGSSGGTIRFASLMEALGEMEAREGGFSQQSHAHRALANGSGKNGQPALFDGGSNINRWHAPLGPASPRVLTLGADLFHPALSANQSVVTWSPSLCHSIDDAGSSLHHQIPLFKSAG